MDPARKKNYSGINRDRMLAEQLGEFAGYFKYPNADLGYEEEERVSVHPRDNGYSDESNCRSQQGRSGDSRSGSSVRKATYEGRAYEEGFGEGMHHKKMKMCSDESLKVSDGNKWNYVEEPFIRNDHDYAYECNNNTIGYMDNYDEIDSEATNSDLKKGGRPKKKCKNSQFTEYPDEFILDFISMISKVPAIWDGSNCNYHRLSYKMIQFSNIELESELHMKKGKPPGSTARSLWNNLEFEYKKYSERLNNMATGSGTSTLVPFKFADELNFLDGPLHDRGVKNSYVVGDRSMFVSEAKKKYVSPPVVNNTPTKKGNHELIDTFKSIASSYQESSKTLREILQMPTNSTESKWTKVIAVIEGHTNGWSELDKMIAEGKIIGFVSTLAPSSM